MMAAVGYRILMLSDCSVIQITHSQQQGPQQSVDRTRIWIPLSELVDNWIGRLNRTTGQQLDSASFYDAFFSASTKTTFDAVSHAFDDDVVR
jgi:hypothetical protein